MKKVLCIILTVAILVSFSVVATAGEKDEYKKFREQDAKAIEQINKNMDKLLAEGKKAAAKDVKSDTTLLRASSLGTYGDILVSLILDSGSIAFAGHAGIVDSNSSITIESFAKSFSPIDKDGVQYYTNNWANSSGALLVRPYGATSSQYNTAVAYSNTHVGKPYNWNFFNKTTTSSFYCSQLVWLAWLDAGIDVEAGSFPNGIIAPADLVNSSNTYVVSQVQ